MKNYYCIIVLGDNSNTETILRKVINGKFNHLNLIKVFVSTFETDLSLWEIEKTLISHKKSFFLTKMDTTNFSGIIQDSKIHDSLFLDFIEKITNISNQESLNEEEYDQTPPPPDFFEYESNEFDIEKELNEIRKNSLNRFKNKYKKAVEVTLSLDELLDKINEVGYDNLSETEKDTLKKYSEK